MANPTLADIGATTWENDRNNWRANDANWLQYRSILRWGTSASRLTAVNALSSPNTAEGTIGYVDDVNQFVARAGPTASSDKLVFLANNLQLSVDTGSSVNLKLASGSVGVQMDSLKVSISGLSTGGSSFEAGRLVATNTDVRIVSPDGATFASLGKVNGASGPLTISSPVTVNGSATVLNSTLGVSGLSTLASLKVNGTSEFSGAVTASGGISGNVTGNLTGNVTSTSSVIGGLTFVGNTITRATSGVTIAESGTEPGILLQTAGAHRTRIRDGSAFAAEVASVVVSTGTPTGDYPENCLWIQV